jgi:hypothetical protein
MSSMLRSTLAVLLLSAVSAAAAEPNLLAEVSLDFAKAAAGQSTVKQECIRDRQGRAVITGTGVSSTSVSVEFVPNSHCGEVHLVLDGSMCARMRARQGRIDVFTDGFVRFHGTKSVCINGQCLWWGPAQVRACPHLDFVDVTTRFCLIDPLMRRVATRFYYRQEDQSHDIFAWKTERRVSQQFDRESGVQLSRAAKSYCDNFLGGLDKNRIRPQELRFSTTADHLMVRARLEGAAPTDWAPIPVIQGRPDIGVRLHQSLLNNAAANIFAGKTRTGAELENDVNSLLGPIGKKVALDPEDKEQFTVTFSPGLPIETNFDAGKIKIMLRTQGFVSGDRVVSDPFLIESLYDLKRVGAGLELLRQGEVSVQPPDVAAGQREISAREVTLSVLLRKRFNKLIPEKVAVEKIELPGELKKVGNLEPTQADSDKGWLTLGLSRSGNQ